MSDFDKLPETVNLGPNHKVPNSVDDLLPEITLEDMAPVLERISVEEETTAQWHAHGIKYIEQSKSYFHESSLKILDENAVTLEQTLPNAYESLYESHIREYIRDGNGIAPDYVRRAREFLLQKSKSNVRHMMSDEYQAQNSTEDPKTILEKEFERNIATDFHIKL